MDGILPHLSKFALLLAAVAETYGALITQPLLGLGVGVGLALGYGVATSVKSWAGKTRRFAPDQSLHPTRAV